MKKFPETFPVLETERLILRSIEDSDVTRLAELANDPDISRGLSSMPYPYTLDVAKEWVVKCRQDYLDNEVLHFAISDKSHKSFMGMVDLDMCYAHNHATAGYWIAKPYWSQGYVPEALHAAMRFAFESLEVHRINAVHFHTNPASGRVLQKVGMLHEGISRQHFLKNGSYYDLHDWGILREEFLTKTVKNS